MLFLSNSTKVNIHLLVFLSYLLISGLNNEKAVDRIPFEYPSSNPLLSTTIDGHEGLFLIDTGGNATVLIDSSFYIDNKFNHTSFYTKHIYGAGTNKQRVKAIDELVDVKIGNDHFKTDNASIMNFRNLGGDFIHGMIGIEYFLDKIVEFNFNEKYMRILEKSDTLELKSFSKLQGYISNFALLVPASMQINDSLTVSGDFILDTGASCTLSLTAPVAKKNQLDKKIRHKVKVISKSGGIGGPADRYLFQAKSVNFGKYKLKNLEARYSCNQSGVMSMNHLAGLLGTKLLERFQVIIDFPNACVYLKPNVDFYNSFKPSDLGLNYVMKPKSEGAWIVTTMIENSPAQKSGIKMDDRIVKVNGIPVALITLQQEKELYQEAKEMVFTVQRGSQEIDIHISPSAIL